MGARVAISSDAPVIRVLTVLASIALLAMPFLARHFVEKFSDSTFAEAVISQNKDAFDRLAEM